MHYMSTIINDVIYKNSLHNSHQKIETKVMLRNLSSADLEYFYTWASDAEVAKTMTWEAYSSKEEAYKFLVEVVEKHPWFKAICLEGVPIGAITLSPGKGNSSCRAELGYVLAKAYWGKGIATAAVKQALDTGFNDLRVQRIEAFVDPDNQASQRVLIKAGMTCEGLLKNYTVFKGSLRDRYVYAITK
jgi:[ribosomal protein S5]-alanine N-acetyltransferase